MYAQFVRGGGKHKSLCVVGGFSCRVREQTKQVKIQVTRTPPLYHLRIPHAHVSLPPMVRYSSCYLLSHPSIIPTICLPPYANLKPRTPRALSKPVGLEKLRHKVVFLDVVHAEREHGGFKTRHLYPPRDLYDTAAALCGAVVVGSCRIGRTSEINLEKLRREATDFWDATERRRNGGGGAKGKRRLIDSDADSATGSGRSSGGHGGSGNESSSGGSGSSSSDSEGSTSSGDGDDDNLTDEESNSDAGSSSGSSSSNSSGSKSSRSRGGESAESSRSSGKEGSSQRKLVGEDCRSDGGARRSRVRRGTKRGKSRQVPQSPGNEARNSGGGNSIPATSWKSALAPGSSSSVVNGQRSEKGDTKACTAVYDRANYEETMSVFGRAVRDALKGQCIENIKLSRVLAVHLYNFIRRECAPFEHPRMSVVEEEAEAEGRAAGIGGKQEAAARRRKEAAERKAKKEAEKAEAKRRAKLGAKAAAEEIRKAKEAAILREIEEERRRRTQVCTCTIE